MSHRTPLQKQARALQKRTGMSYTAALRQVSHSKPIVEGDGTPNPCEHPSIDEINRMVALGHLCRGRYGSDASHPGTEARIFGARAAFFAGQPPVMFEVVWPDYGKLWVGSHRFETVWFTTGAEGQSELNDNAARIVWPALPLDFKLPAPIKTP